MRRIIRFLKYQARSGDTFDALALSAYGDEKLAHRIVEMNPDYADVLIFEGGERLRVPVFDGAADRPKTLPPWRR